MGWACAVAVGEAVTDAGEVVFDAFGVGGGGVGVVVEVLAGDVDALAAELFEGVADGAVVDLGVAGGHAGTGVTEERHPHDENRKLGWVRLLVCPERK